MKRVKIRNRNNYTTLGIRLMVSKRDNPTAGIVEKEAKKFAQQTNLLVVRGIEDAENRYFLSVLLLLLEE